MSADDGTVIRPCHESDVPGVIALFARVFGRTITTEHWRWKLRTSTPAACNVWLAVAGDRPIFQYAGVAQRYQLGNKTALGFVSVDTMTDPEFRRRGLLTRVATRAYEQWREAGAAFVIGLPNQQWGTRTAALGWQELFPLQWLARPLRPEVYAARHARLPFLRHVPGVAAAWNWFFDRRLRRDASVSIVEMQRAGEEFDQFWERLRAHYAFCAVRDRAWVNWRFLDSPSRRYRVLAARRGPVLVGYAAYHEDQSEEHLSGRLAELVTLPGDSQARDALLADIVGRERARGAELIATLAVPGSECFAALRRAGFFGGPEFSVQVVPLACPVPLAELSDRQRWFMSGADYDVI
jgi:hypothetical protein